MIVVQVMMLIGFMLAIPVVVGTIFTPLYEDCPRLPFYWVSGHIFLWAGFQVIAIPMVLTQNTFSRILRSYLVFMVAMLIFALGAFLKRRSKGVAYGKIFASSTVKTKDKRNSLWWIAVGVLLLLQLACIIFLAYQEGDDSYYVALSTSNLDTNRLYMQLPYTGLTTDLQSRHALAPFPVWISFIAKMTGFHPAFLAHVLLPIFLIPLGYCVFYMLGTKMFAEKKYLLPIFMTFVEAMVLFGGYSVYSTENFLLVRTAQGKAVLGNIVVPFLFLLMYLLLNALEKGKRLGMNYWHLLAAVMLAGCLCSTLGTFLLCMLAGLTSLCAVFCYKKLSFVMKMGLCMLIPVGFAVIYFMMD